MKKIIVYMLIMLGSAAQTSWADIHYVNASVSGGSNDGTTWANAFSSLQSALTAASAGDQVWVAEGTYAPHTSDRAVSFAPPAGTSGDRVSIYGGFTSGMTSLDQRDWDAHPTMLSGEIQDDATAANNSYHVVVLGAYTTLDGFVISSGYADGTSPANKGGGVYCNLQSGVEIRNCSFSDNYATAGGAAYNNSRASVYSNCVFKANSATQGGAMYNWVADSVLTDCQFICNSATTEGGAMWNYSSADTISTRCTFEGNTSASIGGAVFMRYNCAPRFDTCTFTTNSATLSGGAVHAWANGSACTPVFTNCTFTANGTTGGTAATDGGGAILSDGCAVTARDCRFLGNTTSKSGGAFHGKASGVNTFSGCTFSANASASGGAAYFNAVDPVFANCTFAANTASGSGGATYLLSGADGTFDNCRFSGNSSTADGGAIFGNSNSSATVSNTVVCGNLHRNGAIAMQAAGGKHARLVNVLFSGNSATGNGGALSGRYATTYADAQNCTFDGNTAASSGGAAYLDNPTVALSLTNCIVWNNSATTAGNALYASGSGASIRIAFSDIQSGVGGGDVVAASSASVINDGGNLDADPRFAHSGTSTWTSDPVKNTTWAQTTFTDGSANWKTDELQGLPLQPDTSSSRAYLVVSNSQKSVTVWGLVDGSSGSTYRIRDAHLQSRSGRWAAGEWVYDGINSPCIDAGDPASDYSLEPDSERINMGFYGNTAEASKSASTATLITVR